MKQANTTASKMSDEEQIHQILDEYHCIVTDDLGRRCIQALASWHQQELERAMSEEVPHTICGYSIDEAVLILSGLGIERATDIVMTMQNLQKIVERLYGDDIIKRM